ncbi:MAG TPA: GAF domain-containing protein [Candidatus Limnocylindrales bacterium]|nr:GAF domain-containing protein [Candidatus Limnocylindrales bacterium]
MPASSTLHPRPIDATLSVTRAADVLGVHPNTVRAWSDAGRLRYYRINPRGDRRYRLSDLQRFLATLSGADGETPDATQLRAGGRRRRVTANSVVLPPIRSGGTAPPSPSPTSEEHQALIALIGTLGDLTSAAVREAVIDPNAPLARAVRAIRDATGDLQVTAWRLHDERLAPAAVSGPHGRGLTELPMSYGILGRALAASPDVVDADPLGTASVSNQVGREIASTIAGPDGAWGVLLCVRRSLKPLTVAERSTYRSIARAVGNVVATSAAAADVAHQIHRADALRRVAGDIGSRLDLEEILSGLVDHALVLFGGDRAAVFLFEGPGLRRMAASRGLSEHWISAVERTDSPTLGSSAIAARRPIYSVGFADDPRVGVLRAAAIQEGFDTACLAPLLDGDQPDPLGLLGVYHDEPHPWTDDELETMAALATQASVAIKGARNFAQLASWAAQLQSIQALGTRLSRLTSVHDIGNAIATELRQLIDYHNVRVYRVREADRALVPVAMLGRVGEYVDETPEQLLVQWGQGITGWVAEHRIAQVLDDADADPRTNTIAGTDPDLDESMLLAPMLYEDDVLGVLVLSKLGLRQFRPDDLRLLEIYASFAAQAMANADATERLNEKSAALEQMVRGQRALLRVTESILVTLDIPELLETTTARLGELVAADNVSLELVDAMTGTLVPQSARGVDQEWYLRPWEPGESGLAPWVVEHNEPQLVIDEYDDPRVGLRDGNPEHGSIICVPLRGRDRAIGVLTVERLGEGRVFSEDEFELVQLFAAQVSVGLQNAEAHRAVERRAQTDILTGLLNHGTFGDQMGALIGADEPFSLVMLDLDRFKGVNDGLGHQAGDRLLRQVADAIVAASRETDSVFRYGGDEFAVLLPRTSSREVGPIAERVRSAVASVVGPGSSWRGRARSLEASAGTSSYPDDGATAEEVLLAADRACFVAKRSGGGRVATAAEGLALAGELTLQTPTPIDLPVTA